MIDALQHLVEKNHGVVLFPNWSNASNFEPTTEKFGTVPLASQELVAAMEEHIDVEVHALKNLTCEQRYIMERTGAPLPILPVDTVKERELFGKLFRSNIGTDFDKMAIEWCKHVDGEQVRPHLIGKTYSELLLC